MPEYLSPGVYVEEIEIGSKPIEGVSTSTAGFLGITERGPVTPNLITSFSQFMQLYGGYLDNSFTAYAVEGFFSNGGQRCFISRIVKADATTAKNTTDFSPLSIKAVGPGSWGNRIAVRVEDASSGESDQFKLTVCYWKDDLPDLSETGSTEEERNKALRALIGGATIIEVFDNLSTSPASSEHFLKKINGISHLIEIEETTSTSRPSNTTGVFMNALTEDGADGTGIINREDMRGNPAAPPGERTGLTAFTEIDEISIICAPDIYSSAFDSSARQQVVDDILTHCELLKDRFTIIDLPSNTKDISNLKTSTSPLRPSKYGAVYFPWIKGYDPVTGRKKLIPPSGHIAGIYARTDVERGVHKAPANEVVRGALELEFPITKGEQDILNPRGINCIRAFPGRGIRVWGARTISSDSLWKYINVRRLFIYLEESIEEGTQWVVFEPNNERLWGRVRASITEFLTRVWRDGALMGKKPEEAFFVKCDRTTMTQDDIDNGRLICVVGIAPVKPAEFVIFRIAQWRGGSDISE